MCSSEISAASYGNFVHEKDNYKLMHFTIISFSFTVSFISK